MNLPNKLFIDTSFFIALANSRDSHHAQALLIQSQLSQQKAYKYTSEYVLIELGNGLSRLRFRPIAQRIIQLVRTDQSFEVVSATPDLFAESLALFNQRDDKEWGLTDCSSFVIMKQLNIDTALTADHHFVQAGFQILLSEDN